ncbi:MAG TPA: hypothetical protein VJ302_33610 [Blastocatellia bacterium]|nr:hypothetical protein [Blastocatellia bacterium]
MRLIKIMQRALLSLFLLPVIGSPIFAQWNSFQYPNNGATRFRWQGVVDGTSFVRIRGRQVTSETQSGLPVQNQQFDFTDALPRTQIRVELTGAQGRGRVSLVEQPRPSNDYTAVVRIDDNNKGRSLYSFELQWVDLTRRDRESDSEDRLEEVTWRGRVDGESIIRFRDNQVRYQTVGGQGVSGVNFRFSSPLPDQEISVNLTNTEGRGEITLVEQPNRGNDFSAAVRVRDDRGGSGIYAFTLTWNRSRFRGNDRDRDNYDRDRDRDRDRYRDRDRDDNSQGSGRGFRWSGRVDGRELLYIKGNRLRVEHQAGQLVTEENHRFFQPLPFERRNVVVRKLDGRGNVTVIQQPSRENGYTAAILIEDREGGSDRYDLEVDW